MPQEKKKRGRREEKKSNKRKLEDVREKPSKRFRPEDHETEEAKSEVIVTGDAGDDFIGFDLERPQGMQIPDLENDFHGLLEPEEQEYYSNINAKIVANDFESGEDRSVFIEAVHRETEGKELKVASSQSSSRFLEKIIIMSTPYQLRSLFSKLLGNLTSLVQHRFGSHCCETLFLEAAKYVGQEKKESQESRETRPPSMEELFLQAAEELKPNMGFLLTDRFASHTVRVLFLVLSGEPLDDASVRAMLASKKKERIETPEGKANDVSLTSRTVPKSFPPALSELISSAISSLDTTYIRALATHNTGNPVLQLLLQLELANSNRNKPSDTDSLFNKLLPDEPLEEDTESGKFISGLVYDPTGSHLVEMLVQKLPGKKFKSLYKNVLKPKLGSMSKNDTASYVAIRILERLGKDDLLEAKALILPEVPTLISRRRTGLIKVLVERSAVRGVDLLDLADVLKTGYGNDTATFISSVLNHKPTKKKESAFNDDGSTKASTQKADVHGSLLGQAMLQAKGTSSLVQDSLLSLSADDLLSLCGDPSASRLIQMALQPSPTNIAFRRQFVPSFYGTIVSLSLELTGSYVADALYSATDGLHFMKEKLAKELSGSETRLRESPFGRNVWRNWAMDMYQRRPNEWRAVAKKQHGQDKEQEARGGAGGTNAIPPQQKKTAIQLARERHAQRKLQDPTSKSSTPATPANAVVSTNA